MYFAILCLVKSLLCMPCIIHDTPGGVNDFGPDTFGTSGRSTEMSLCLIIVYTCGNHCYECYKMLKYLTADLFSKLRRIVRCFNLGTF